MADNAQGQPVVLGSGFVAKYPAGGGNFWVPLQYLRGFRDLGCEVYWLEVLGPTDEPATDRHFIETFLNRVLELGVSDHVVLAYYPAGFSRPEYRELHGAPPDWDARCRSALLLNLVGSFDRALRAPFARTVLFDLDPGLFQIWASQWDMGVGHHDVHLTIGQHLGHTDSPIPDGGVDWKKIWPSVHLPSWPVVSSPGSAYTTVTQWWSPESAWLDGQLFDCSKRQSFIHFLELPRLTSVALELAANLHPAEEDERTLFTSHGWRLVAPEVEVRTPQQFHAYVQQSRGEFGCAKPAYVKGRTGWLSDRSVCYMASGRPCVLQDTAASQHLPESAGLGFFSTTAEAVERLAAIEADYAAAARAARRLAEEVFATSVQLPQVLALAGA